MDFAEFSALLEAERAKTRERNRAWRKANPEKQRAAARAWQKANPEKAREHTRAWRKANPEKQRAAARAWQKANPEKARERNRKSKLKLKYGLTTAEWETMFEAQGRCCASCKATNPGSKYGWHTDHCHETGETRGILCRPCNVTLGHAKDNPAWLRALADYLER